MTIFIMILSFLLAIGGVTYYAYRKSRAVDATTSEGLFLGGRSMTAIPIAGTIIMANLSTEQLIGQNGQSYVAGMEIMAWEVTAGIALVVLAVVFLPKYLKYGIDTIPDLLEMRFDTTTKRIISALTIFTYAVAFLPSVLYSGALAFNELFGIDELLGINPLTSIILIVAIIAVISILYLVIGGISLSIHSNVWFGLGLLIFGLGIPIAGLFLLGDGGFISGLDHIITNTPELLNSVGPVDSEYIPWPTLFTGMLANNLFFWGTNQMIVQKTFTAKNLGEAQKGTLLVGVFKVIAAFVTVLPGVIARNAFGDALLSNQDAAYPTLVAEVLPTILYGLFAAVIFGALLSTVIGALNSIATLFSLDFYKGMINKKASDTKVARVGVIAIIVMGIISIIISPFISQAPAGLYNVIQEFNGFYSMPLLVLVLAAFYSKKATPLAAKTTLIVHFIVYGLLNWVLLTDISYLYNFAILFVIDVLVLFLVSKLKPGGNYEITSFSTKVDIKPWKYAKVSGIVLIILIILTYVVFSPLGIAA